MERVLFLSAPYDFLVQRFQKLDSKRARISGSSEPLEGVPGRKERRFGDSSPSP